MGVMGPTVRPSTARLFKSVGSTLLKGADSLFVTLLGKRVVAAARGLSPQSYEDKLGLRDPFNLFVRTLIKDSLATTILQRVGHEENVRLIMKSRVHTGGSLPILTNVLK